MTEKVAGSGEGQLANNDLGAERSRRVGLSVQPDNPAQVGHIEDAGGNVQAAPV